MTELQQLREIAQQIHDWQQREGLSDNELLKQCGLLGSTKTYRRILNPTDDLSVGIDIERQLHAYQQQLLVIETRAAAGAGAEDDYDDLDHVVRARLAVTEAMGEKGNNRLVIIEGPSGAGKSTIRRCLIQRWPNIAVPVDADETWRESLTAMLSTLLIEVGPIDRNGSTRNRDEVLIPPSAIDQKRKLFAALSAKRRILLIDEAHHMGVRTLNMVKSILNETPTIVVFLAIGTLLKRLEQNAYEEARQLTRNRLCERVTLSAPDAKETLSFLQRRGVKFADAGEAKNCAAKLAEESRTRGNWNFVNLVARKARKASMKSPIDTEQFVEALTAAIKTR
jgi:type II secretory pathway predicted ATPase ExeA